MRGFQLRYAALVAGSLVVLLIFAGLHGIYIVESYFPQDLANEFRSSIQGSTWRLFAVGTVYVAVVTMAAIFLSHRAVGPAHRLEEEIRKMAESSNGGESLKIREGDDFEGLVQAINQLLKKVRKA